MPTNEQRRDVAKRKLERQLVRRQEQQKSRRQRTVIGAVIAAVVVIAGVVFVVTRPPADESATAAEPTPEPTSACTYTDAETTVKAVQKPDNTNPLTSGTVDATITLGQGTVPVTLDRSFAPCAVNAFVSLASQGYYNETSCHRLTTAENFKILQCGDPSGTGRGGPGYSYAAEAAPVTDPAADPATTSAFPVGTLAMATTPGGTGGGTNGSQFVVVYGESDLSSGGLTKIGTVGAEGLAVVDQIAAKGTVDGSNGVADVPAEKVDVTSVTVPEDALTPTQPPAATETTPADGLPTDAVPTDAAPSEAEPTDPAAAPTDAGATDPAAAPTDAGTTDPAAAPTDSSTAPTS
ncbi:peptidylprolyl isomerase [Nakamurella deserti]|uniref:peptidylprolyl isomerase n=1 Tax=Nakamurella deserti TaxID=2164074 RepID=UPI00197CA6CD|nr:peptidylprolyl isomerase [Nakamurella deserti]